MATRARARRGRRGHYPLAIEKAYQRKLVGIAKRSAKRLAPIMKQALARYGEELDERALDAGRRVDGLADDLASAVTLAEIPDTLPEGDIARVGSQVGLFTASDTNRQAIILAQELGDKEALGAMIRLGAIQDVSTATMEKWISRNLVLASSIAPTYHDQVRDLILQAWTESRSSLWLGDKITERGLVAAGRARLIARNEIGTLYSQVTKERQTSLGITKFRWSTSEDERVREEHAAINGDIFTWADGAPGEGFPGEPINCRCVAIPVL